jgi:hypothetical protein
VFYQAIRERQYFKDVLEAKNPSLMVKKLRYYARYLVICLLLNKTTLTKEVMSEFEQSVDAYLVQFDPADAAEWKAVLQELAGFLEMESTMTIKDEAGNPLVCSTRLLPEKVKMDRDGPRLRLSEVVLVGNVTDQARFSELTLDMYRMLQCLEREPVGKRDNAKQGSMEDLEARRANPHKYLLYRPTISQVMLHLATSFKELRDTGCLLLYLSADGTPLPVMAGDFAKDFGKGGILLAGKRSEKDQDSIIRTSTLHPGDLVPYTRKPLFLIVDSPTALAYEVVPRPFGQPMVIFMSPPSLPPHCHPSVLTLFLHAPVRAFCLVSNLTQTTQETWAQLTTMFVQLEREVTERLVSVRLDASYKRFIQDDFLRAFVARFIIAHFLLVAHKEFKPEHMIRSQPVLPLDSFMLSPRLQNIIDVANVSQMYNLQ